MTDHSKLQPVLARRAFLQVGAGALALGRATAPIMAGTPQAQDRKPTQFQIACMTLPYSQFPLERALTGLKAAGFEYVAWGTSHLEAPGKSSAIMPAGASADSARDLGKKCRDMGLEPLMMFSGVYPEAKDHLEVMKHRILQAQAAGIGQLLTFGNTRGGDRPRWIEHFRLLGPFAREHRVLIVVKPHGGLSADGLKCLEIVRDVADASVKVNYDAGNVMDYLKWKPEAVLQDFRQCASEVHSFCIKDHRSFPRDQDCGPGLGEIDHYRLLAPVAFTGRPMPLCCENISAPGLPRPTKPEGVDALARRAREFLELVIQAVQA